MSCGTAVALQRGLIIKQQGERGDEEWWCVMHVHQFPKVYKFKQEVFDSAVSPTVGIQVPEPMSP